MVRKFGPKNVVFHWYSGPEDILDEILSSGYFVSGTPSVEERKEHRNAIDKTPVDRLLLETDSPAKNYEPSDLRNALNYISKMKGIDEVELAKVTTRNAIQFFGILKNYPSPR